MRLIEIARKAATGVMFLGVLTEAQDASCKNIPGDDGWPSQSEWAQLNETVRGRLIATVPQASVCHLEPYKNFDETACETLRGSWNVAPT